MSFDTEACNLFLQGAERIGGIHNSLKMTDEVYQIIMKQTTEIQDNSVPIYNHILFLEQLAIYDMMKMIREAGNEGLVAGALWMISLGPYYQSGYQPRQYQQSADCYATCPAPTDDSVGLDG